MRNVCNSKLKIKLTIYWKISIAVIIAICDCLLCHHSHKVPYHML
jgi:hypothetical protein